MDNIYDGWTRNDEDAQRRSNKRYLLQVVATDELVRELNRRGYEVSYTDPELRVRVVEVEQ